jgi:predicted short-subunit dehydrogenase-like oxidoreductase (DUF2520 family)
MEFMKIQHVSIAGAGNLAWHLALAFRECGITIREVTNRNRIAGKELADRVNARFVDSPSNLDPAADMILIAVSDNAIHEVASSIRNAGNTLLVHTSGSTGIEVLREASSNTGVFYPLQTFRKGTYVAFRNVPVCVEAINRQDEESLLDLGRMLSDTVMRINSEDRKMLHLAAVFASNFPNYMYSIAEEILKTNDLPFSLLGSLIRQTAAGAEGGDVFTRQTGPAIREDKNILETHLQLLKNHPDYQRIYNLISQSIIQHKEKDVKL